MKNKRQKSKIQTFEKIIKATKSLIIKEGILNLKSLEVAKKAGIAHGTLFAHFETKELLIAEICQKELKQIARKLKEIADVKSSTIEILLDKYLTLVAKNEGFYMVIAKEFPFLDEHIQKSIIGNETIIRNILYQKIEKGIEEGIYEQLDITMTIALFFAGINFYLSRKEYFIKGRGKLMEQKKKQIIDTFLRLLK